MSTANPVLKWQTEYQLSKEKSTKLILEHDLGRTCPHLGKITVAGEDQ